MNVLTKAAAKLRATLYATRSAALRGSIFLSRESQRYVAARLHAGLRDATHSLRSGFTNPLACGSQEGAGGFAVAHGAFIAVEFLPRLRLAGVSAGECPARPAGEPSFPMCNFEIQNSSSVYSWWKLLDFFCFILLILSIFQLAMGREKSYTSRVACVVGSTRERLQRTIR